MDSDISNNQPNHDAPSAPPVPKGVRPEDIVRRQQQASSMPANEAPAEEPATDEPEDTQPDSPQFPYVKPSGKDSRFKRFFRGYWHKKLWTLPLTLVVILGVVFAVPMTRYKILAFFIAKPFTITVTDSSTGTPVSGATVELANKSATTDGEGKVSITSPVGSQMLSVSKTYYKQAGQTVFVGLRGSNAVNIKLVATGRQIPVKVVNKITGAPLAEVVLTFAHTTAKTGADGTATAVLSASPDTQDAVLSVDGYIDLNVKVNATAAAVEAVDALPANTFAMVPVGRVYFLSNLSGKIDVVSTNLDGSGRQTVLAGTGSEDANTTLLLASRDWKYLALLSKRGSGDAKLYLIAAASGQLTTIDSNADIFTPVGWSGHYFVYKANDTSVQNWQSGGTVIKSYNADTGKSVTLASTTATGTSNADAKYQNIWDASFVGDSLVYDITWYVYPGTLSVAGQQDTLMSVKPDGTGSKTLKSVDASQYYISNLNAANPVQAYFGVYSSTSSAANYYRLDGNGSVTQSSTITSDSVSKSYPTYLLSPSGNATFWGELRDGKNTLFTGDATGSNATQIATLSDYTAYGWCTDNYLLVQKGGSELYIMPSSGSGTPLKVSDYYKPQYGLYGFDGSYGGL